MKTISDLSAVGARVEEAVRNLPELAHDPPLLYAQFESVCIATLDSEWADYPQDVLENYLQNYLGELRKRLGVSD